MASPLETRNFAHSDIEQSTGQKKNEWKYSGEWGILRSENFWGSVTSWTLIDRRIAVRMEHRRVNDVSYRNQAETSTERNKPSRLWALGGGGRPVVSMRTAEREWLRARRQGWLSVPHIHWLNSRWIGRRRREKEKRNCSHKKKTPREWRFKNSATPRNASRKKKPTNHPTSAKVASATACASRSPEIPALFFLLQTLISLPGGCASFFPVLLQSKHCLSINRFSL